MAANEAGMSLIAWRKKIGGSKGLTMSAEEWAQVIGVCTDGAQDAEPTMDLLSLLLAVLKALLAVITESVSDQALVELVHQTLLPSFKQVEPGQQSLARALLAALQSSFKPMSKKATECCEAAALLADKLPQPPVSTSHQEPWLLPLFSHIFQQGLDQRWTLSALLHLALGIPYSSLPAGLLEKLMADMEISDNMALRAALIVLLLHLKWEHGKHTGGTIAAPHFCRTILDPIAHLFEPSTGSPKRWQHVQRYLYPELVAAFDHPLVYMEYFSPYPQITKPGIMPHASFSSPDAGIECWATIAAEAIQSRRIGIKHVERKMLLLAAEHASADVRVKALQIATQHDDLLGADPHSLRVLQSVYDTNADLHGTGERSDYIAAITQFFKHLDQELKIAHRAVKRVQNGHSPIQGITLQQIKEDPPQHRRAILLNPAQAVEQGKLLKLAGLLWCRLNVTFARRPPVSRVMVALMMLKSYLEVFHDAPNLQEEVFDEFTVQSLLVCLTSEFTDVRRRARELLESSTIDLPGYGPGDKENIEKLYSAGSLAAEHPRRTQADAGRAAICLWFTRFNWDHENDPKKISELTDRLEEFVYECELDLSTGMRHTPLHGRLAVLRDLILCLKFGSIHQLKEFEAVFRRLLRMVDRVWALTRPVISLKRSDDPDNRPDHEIARAYEVAAAAETGDDEANDDNETSNVTELVSGCWRATVGAGELLTALYTVTMPVHEHPDAFWSSEDVDDAGQRFLTWMHEVRHRGTFSKLATAFAELVQSVKKVSSLARLPMSWLDVELGVVRQGGLSTTRRSAALPYSVLAIVSGDAAWTDKANNSLLEMADIKSATSDDTKVHAFNVLQVELTDAKQNKFLDRYFERAVMTAIAAFESANWNVRNVGLILFSTLIHRSLNLGNNQDVFEYQRSSSARQTFAAWHAKYPSILPYVTGYLADYDLSARASQHSPLFPMLIIIRSLRYSEPGEKVQRPLVPAVERLLASREWQVRKVAAQALTALHSHQDAVTRATEWTIDSPGGSNNLVHGRYHLLSDLLNDVIDWSRVDDTALKQIGTNILAALREHYHSPLVDIRSIVLRCATVFLDRTKYAELVPQSDLVNYSGQAAGEVLRPATETGKPINSMSMWMHVMHLQDNPPAQGKNVDTLLQMLRPTNTFPEVQQLPGLWILDGSFGEVNIEAVDHPQLLKAVIRLVQSTTQDTDVRVSAMNALYAVEWDLDAIDAVDVDTKTALAHGLADLTRASKYVPIREAALKALAQVAVWLMSDDSDLDQVYFYAFSEALTIFAHEAQSLPARESALQALRIVERYIFPSEELPLLPSCSLLPLHQTLYQLLHDDDLDVRAGAAKLVAENLDLPVTLSHPSTVARWLSAVFAQIMPVLDDTDVEEWLGWFVGLVIDMQGLQADYELAFGNVPTDKVLFEVEPPNLFRDGRRIGRQVAQYLLECQRSFTVQLVPLAATLVHLDSKGGDEALAALRARTCPIEDRFEGFRRIIERKTVLEQLMLDKQQAEQNRKLGLL